MNEAGTMLSLKRSDGVFFEENGQGGGISVKLERA